MHSHKPRQGNRAMSREYRRALARLAELDAPQPTRWTAPRVASRSEVGEFMDEFATIGDLDLRSIVATFTN